MTLVLTDKFSRMKITIITTTFNSEKTIRDTFESVLNQTYNNIEYIVVDGHSNDSTLEIIREYETRFNGRMRWISEPDNGIYDAMNKGIRMATGDVIGILNSDDFFRDTNVLMDIVNSISRADAVYGDIMYVSSSNPKLDVRPYSSPGFKLWMFKLGLMPAHPSFYCKRHVYEKYGLYATDLPIAADFDFIIRVMYKYRIKTNYIHRNFISMRIGGASSSGIRSYFKNLKDRKVVFKRNAIKSNYIFLGIGYLIKIWQLVKFRIKNI